MSKTTLVKKNAEKPKKKRAGVKGTNDIKFNTYIQKILKQVHPDTGISSAAMESMENFVKIMATKIMLVANQFHARDGRKTLSSRGIQTAVFIVLPKELAKHAVSEGTRSVTKYHSMMTNKTGSISKTRETTHSLAGLTMGVSRVRKIMKLESNAKRIGLGAPIYLAAVLEYLSAEILELAGNGARDNKKIRITTRHIKLAIKNDEELNNLFKNVILSGGVVPHVHNALKPQRREK